MKETEVVRHRLQNLNKSIEDSVEFGAKIKEESNPYLEIYHLDLKKRVDEDESKTLFDRIVEIAEESTVGFTKLKVKLQSNAKRKIARVKSMLEKYEFDTVNLRDHQGQYFLGGELKI